MLQQIVVFLVLVATLGLFVWGRWRYDVVALLALLAVTIAGVIPGDQAFAGFGHPAVITVAAVLVLSRGLQNSGVVALLAKPLAHVGEGATAQVGALSGLTAALSAFMNNVGALALLLPVAIRMARKSNRSPSLLLMPLAFASLLGGLVTLIGTPPNIIIATFRAETGQAPFRMFDFTPVGLGVAVAGLIFVTLIGWRMVPQRKGTGSRSDLFEIGDYVTEVHIPANSALAGKRLRDLGQISDAEVVVIAVVREKRRHINPSGFEALRSGDLLVVQADPEDLHELIEAAGLELTGSPKRGEEALDLGEHSSLMEAVVMADSPIVGETARSLNLRWRYSVNLLGVARMGARIHQRLRDIRFRVGDVLLLQGPAATMTQTLASLGCLPLAGRGLNLGAPRRVGLGVGIFGGALLLAAVGLLPIQVAFVAAAVAMLLTNILSLREAYESIDWSVIVLLGAMIPVGQALEVSGGADLIAQATLAAAGQLPPVVSLIIVLVATMFLSDLVNNAAAAVLMAPIAISVAYGLGASVDPFLMAVAIGASCAFLTPIGHQSNTLVMGPAGYQFGDYWRMGLLLEAIIVAVAIPLITLFWPFGITP
ncbi:MAG: SLC13 family permease [Caldilineales bacterium]|nr:SLC13 family permease [Caldilineales bacterium]